MKKNLIMWVIIFLFIISIIWTYHYVSNNGEFEKLTHVTVGKELLNERKVVYLCYRFRWEGIGNPSLEKVEFIKKDGTMIAKVDNQILIKPYISKIDCGTYHEEDAIKEGIVKTLLPVKGFKPDEEFSLVLRVELNDYEWNSDISSIRITYNKFGQSVFQNIPFDDGLITEE
ncbi:hypothetical protein JYA63_15615 [Fictibacillus nanhaiensis]|uniref:DUF5067 domain-containing protein n=1 Tax=Fictibacillus nanhaiensis TaxID=742169 RepID=A0ABS2ZS67_9BACL|nr:hypothetical protein [Fictibacillus nanhaiensis]